jgi:hypothetical protein
VHCKSFNISFSQIIKPTGLIFVLQKCTLGWPVQNSGEKHAIKIVKSWNMFLSRIWIAKMKQITLFSKEVFLKLYKATSVTNQDIVPRFCNETLQYHDIIFFTISFWGPCGQTNVCAQSILWYFKRIIPLIMDDGKWCYLLLYFIKYICF